MTYHPIEPPPPPEPPRLRSVLQPPEVQWWEWALVAFAFVAVLAFGVFLGTL